MNELDSILNSYKIAKDEQCKVILATVVHVKGSSYRRAGARMLVDEYGNMTGSISGGCLEGDALRKALHAQAQNENKLIRYDTSDEDDAIIGAQLGCNGIIQVLFEPIDFADENNPIEILRQLKNNKSGVVCTFFNLNRKDQQHGTTCWINHEEVKGVIPELYQEQLVKDSNEALQSDKSLFREYINEDSSQYVFLEVMKPPVKIVIVGAGNDARVLSNMANLLGWERVVIDGRSTHANSARFQGGCQVIVTKPDSILDKVEIDDRTAFVLMTHNYSYDFVTLRLLLKNKQLKYIGILGPKIKFDRMLSDLNLKEEENQKLLSNVHAPIGLELGTETPSEIALSILSEIQAVMSGTKALFLKDKDGPIHKERNYNFKQVKL